MKKHTRKYAAAALAVAGVAGLSLAAAATLTVDTAQEIAIGSGTFAPCDADGVTVSYDYTTADGEFVINTVTVGDIDAACTGESILLSLSSAAGEELAQATGSIGGASFVYDATGHRIPIAADLGQATVIISG